MTHAHISLNIKKYDDTRYHFVNLHFKIEMTGLQKQKPGYSRNGIKFENIQGFLMNSEHKLERNVQFLVVVIKQHSF